MIISAEIEAANIVLIGRFNPRIFNPDWFARFNCITDSQAKSAEVKIVHPDVAVMEFDTFQFVAEAERLMVSSVIPPFVGLSDFLGRVFGEYLIHTPIGIVGINRSVHLNVGSLEVRDQLGVRLAPREPWGEWGRHIDDGDLRTKGGLRSITMEQRNLGDRINGHVRVKLEPSTQISTGVFIEVNDEYHTSNIKNPAGAAEAVEIFTNCWEKSMMQAVSIFEQIDATVRGLSR